MQQLRATGIGKADPVEVQVFPGPGLEGAEAGFFRREAVDVIEAIPCYACFAPGIVELDQLAQRRGEPGRQRIERNQRADAEAAVEDIQGAHRQQGEGQQPGDAVRSRSEAVGPSASLQKLADQELVFCFDVFQNLLRLAEMAHCPGCADTLDGFLLKGGGLLHNVPVYPFVHPMGDQVEYQIDRNECQHEKG